MALAKSEDKNEKDLFPFQKPFVALHSFSALQICLREEALEVSFIAAQENLFLTVTDIAKAEPCVPCYPGPRGIFDE